MRVNEKQKKENFFLREGYTLIACWPNWEVWFLTQKIFLRQRKLVLNVKKCFSYLSNLHPLAISCVEAYSKISQENSVIETIRL